MPRPQVSISGVPYDIAVVRLDGNVVLRLYTTDAAQHYDIVIPSSLSSDVQVTLPSAFAVTDQEANLKIDDVGAISPNYPQPYIVDQATLEVGPIPNQTTINTQLNLIKAKINEMLAALRLALVLDPVNKTISANPARLAMTALNPQLIIPLPAEMAIQANYNNTFTPAPAEMGITAIY